MQTIAGMAARRVKGVYGPGQVVSVEVGGRWAAVDVDVVAEYGVAIMPLVQAVRCNVVEWVQTMTGLEVVEVNVVVRDLHMPGADEPDHVVTPELTRPR